jgi:thiosulfate/3-mercaptopyruvate sulfurtransferase
VVWTLKVLGLKELSVLNGGVQAWVAAGLALDTMPEVVQASTYTPTLDTTLIATREELLAQPAAPQRACWTHAPRPSSMAKRGTRLRACRARSRAR